MTEPRTSPSVLVCMACSMLRPINTPHGEDSCYSRDWRELPLVEDLSVSTEIVMPHPDGGWPEVHVTRHYMVRSEDRDVVEAERRRLLEEAADAIE